jgi:hypothetical protein
VAGAAVGVVGSALSSDKKGGAGTQTATKEPWAEAAPWLKDLLAQGQSLNNQYTATPFNAQQQQAFGNMANQSAYMQNLTPSLLGQLSGQQLGYDRNNPTARPQAFNFNGLLGGAGGTQGGGQQAGLLSMLGNGNAINSSMMAMPQAQLPMAPVVDPKKEETTDPRDPYAWLFDGSGGGGGL